MLTLVELLEVHSLCSHSIFDLPFTRVGCFPEPGIGNVSPRGSERVVYTGCTESTAAGHGSPIHGSNFLTKTRSVRSLSVLKKQRRFT